MAYSPLPVRHWETHVRVYTEKIKHTQIRTNDS